MNEESERRLEHFRHTVPNLNERVLKEADTTLAPVLRRLNITPADLEAALNGHSVAKLDAFESADRSRNFALEAIVKRVGRPSYLIHGRAVDYSTGADFATTLPGLLSQHRVEARLLSVGRVNTINHPSMAWVGTAWLVADKGSKPIAITNRHVASEFARRRGTKGEAVFLRDPRSMVKYGAMVDFLQIHDDPQIQEAVVTGVRYLAHESEPDIAILELEDTGWLGAPFELADAEAGRDELFATIGYPARDSRNAADAQAEIFRDIYDKKRLAVGYIVQPAGSGRLMQHDASTLGGASGSPLVSLVSGKVVGLHFAGRYLEFNNAVSVASLKRALAGTAVPGIELPAALPQEKRDSEHEPGHFTERVGYVETFLEEAASGGARSDGAFTVPLPVPSDTSDLAERLDAPGKHVLEYMHFSILYSADRRCPRLTAVNIDGSQPFKIKRGDDQWFADLRIPKEVQLTSADFPGDFDRGHLVRREDPNWGDEAAATMANGDTFHYTNAGLQHALLNRDKKRWLGLEDYILRSAATHGFKASVFAGPIMTDDDPVLIEDESIQVPLAYWKVVAMVAADGKSLHATGYVLGQAAFVASLTESFEIGNFNFYQVPIRDIEQATGISFGPLRDADPLARRVDAERADRPVHAIALEALEDIIL
ncbi:MAG TPA: DNA/RNA non-specific endonuclease [Allosphingosinicella sp.]